MKIQLTIVRKTLYLSLYPIQHIDSQTKSLLEKHLSLISIPPHITKTYVKLLDCYLGLVSKKIYYELLDCNESCLTIFEGFVASIKSEQLIQFSRQSKETYQRATNRLIDSLRNDFPHIRDLNSKSNLDFEQTFDVNMIEYYQGWFVSGKSKTKQSFLNLVWFSKQFSLDKSRILHQSAKGYFVRLVSTRNVLPTLNEFFTFLEINYSSISDSDLQNTNFISSIVSDFCRSYFHSKKNEGRCFETSIKRWNDSIEVMNKVVFDSGVFKGDGRGFPYVPPKRKTGEDSQVITTDIGSEVKVKLLTDIPIYVTDDQAIELLFVKIHADVAHVVNWAESCVNEQFKNFKNNGDKFNYQDLGTGAKNIRKKYNVKINKGETLYELAKSFGLPTSYTLEPYMFLLINEHQEITEAFLLGLALYDKFDHLVGIEKNDNGTWLVGYKGRKGSGSSQQKILLNQTSEQIVEKILEVTSPLRKFLREKEDVNYRYMFLSSGVAMQYPKKVSGTLEGARQEKQGGRERVEEMMSYSQLNIEDAKLFVKNLTLSKFRSSRALEVYLDTGSAQAMANALGHAKYKPELLSHYLPEPILQFFQSRWISIFQKAIVCKAMEGSSNILEATKFQSMEELDEFLKNHALKNIPENEKVGSELESNNTNASADSVFISVDEDILTALLSLEKAVNESDIKVSPKAMYWANFSSTLSKEIESQDYDINLNKILASAKEKIDICSMRQVIHENV